MRDKLFIVIMVIGKRWLIFIGFRVCELLFLYFKKDIVLKLVVFVIEDVGMWCILILVFIIMFRYCMLYIWFIIMFVDKIWNIFCCVLNVIILFLSVMSFVNFRVWV